MTIESIAIALVVLVLVIGVLVDGLVERRINRKIAAELVTRFECTCGWHGSREGSMPPLSLKCPRCAGVAVRRRA